MLMAGEQLLVSEGNERGKRLEVQGELLIGRSAPDVAGRLGDDPEISRRHARVFREADGRLMVEDLGSANGTWVNDARVHAPLIVNPGDLVRVGRTVLQVTDAAGNVQKASPPPTRRAEPAGPAAPAAPPTPPAAPPVTPREELVVTAGPASGRRLGVHDELEIGRAVSGEGRLSEDAELSRRHARVLRQATGELTIEDLGSANGTWVNGEQVRGLRILRLGDVVRIGTTTMQLAEYGAAPPPAPREAAPPRAAAPPPAPPPAPQPVAEPAPSGTELPVGAVFAGCRVEEVISYGNMGIVYRAEELALQRLVALKVITAEYSREERFRKRFQREQRVAAAIDHPNVIPIFDAGEDDGVLFITMRLVQGTDLQSLLTERQRLEPLRGARIIRQVGAALDAAHSRGMLHRDVKASNVLLGREDHAYLSDFGLAKRADEEAGLTRQGSIVARAVYVPPEQILGQRVDARGDIYSLGCLLFEALTGEPPFARWQGGPQALAHVEAPAPSPLEVRPDLPREFDEVVRRAMAKDPSDRYPSAGDLGQAALVAAGGLRRASPWSVVATGEAALVTDGHEAAAGHGPEPRVAVPDGAEAPAAPGRDKQPVPGGAERPEGADTLRLAIAVAGLLIAAVFMIAALSGISGLSH
jgi:pSer/pThr/pTyr-binding forkhead associated (FHA) protein